MEGPIAQRIKATLGITGYLPRVHIDGEGLAPDAGSSHPGAVIGPKGWAVRPLKINTSWSSERREQFGPIRRGRRKFKEDLLLVRGGPEWTYRWCTSCSARASLE